MCRQLARAALCTFVALLAATRVAGAADPRPIPHIRSADSQVVKLLREACRRSATLQRLVTRIEQSDVIVYVQVSSQVPKSMEAYLRWVGAGPVHRYLCVVVKVPTSDEKLITLLGHELQHATEVASALDVRDEVALDALYRRIGDDSGAGYDSPEARSVGAIVRNELRGHGRPVDVEATMRSDERGAVPTAGDRVAPPAGERERASARAAMRVPMPVTVPW